MIYPLTLNKSDPEFLFFESKLDYFGSHEFYSWQPKYLFLSKTRSFLWIPGNSPTWTAQLFDTNQAESWKIQPLNDRYRLQQNIERDVTPIKLKTGSTRERHFFLFRRTGPGLRLEQIISLGRHLK